jgi:uncharacterized protein
MSLPAPPPATVTAPVAATAALPNGAAAPAPAVRNDVPLSAIAPADWDRLAGGAPLASHAFLDALHQTGCASPATGWTPRYLTAWRDEKLVGAMPLYAKTHSYGEYVFDWAWADAYRRYGRRYYPKLVAALPFTPASGPRLLAGDDGTRAALLAAALDEVHRAGPAAPSSLHLLFVTAAESAMAERAGMMIRHGVQFRWENRGYRDFGDYLAAFNHDKRKKVKQERRRVADAGVTFERRTGTAITADDWAFFHRCYVTTYQAHHSTPYLSLPFFRRIGATMGDHLLLAIGRRDGVPVCAALDVFDANTLWGRYWGALDYVPGLHFEACYYQAIEFCIERGIVAFEGGAQGVHKLARGLTPVTTHSAHALADPDFAAPVAEFCARERIDVAHTVDELAESAPFRREGDGGDGGG